MTIVPHPTAPPGRVLGVRRGCTAPIHGLDVRPGCMFVAGGEEAPPSSRVSVVSVGIWRPFSLGAPLAAGSHGCGAEQADVRSLDDVDRRLGEEG